MEIYNPLVDEKYKDYFYTTVRGKSYQLIPIHLRSEYVGKMNVKVTGITLYDYFGVFSLSKQLNEQTALFVLPGTYDIDLLGNSRESIISEYSLSTDHTKGIDANDIIAIKEYVLGDNLKQIHWKLSSKLDELLVKEMSEVITSSQFILLETAVSDVHPNEIDAMIEAFYSISKAMIKSDQTHYFGWFDRKYNLFRRKEIHSLDQLNDHLQDLLSISFKVDHQSSIATFLQNTYDIRVSQLIYITSSEPNRESLDESIHMITIRCTSHHIEKSLRNTEDTIHITPYTLEEDLRKLPI
ncbi:DUF58 domain-containing protein [Pseudogracilibacillus sp. SO30301A]|uniref:DUF58 domain-containing protein n=1 Tax=Pseudogracilibacillus sp. SO30301A TaxID=3098291 RepID=UPI00300E256C